jgi:hypothetical protein
MTRLMLLCAWLCAMAFVVAAKPAQAVGNYAVTYVANNGNDSYNCSSTATPCRSFQGALDQTANYGEIDCLNTGYYTSGVTISQSVTIDCAGGVGSSIGNIIVNGADIVVRLRNLSFNGEGFGSDAVDAKNMAALYIENCVITNFDYGNAANEPPFIGIKFEPSVNAQLFVTNSIISNNGYSGSGSVSGGIYVVPMSGVTAQVSIDRSEISGNIFGIVADGTSGGTVRAIISDSVVSGNTEDGIAALSSGSPVWVLVDQTKVSGNGFGIADSGGGSELLARNISVFGNVIGLHANDGGTLYSYGNNSINGNTTNGTFTGTIGLQ